jgi:hypothetical protein
MGGKKQSEQEDEKPKSVVVSALLTVQDIQRLKRALAEGKLRELGVLDVQFPQEATVDSEGSAWSRKESARDRKGPNDKSTTL